VVEEQKMIGHMGSFEWRSDTHPVDRINELEAENIALLNMLPELEEAKEDIYSFEKQVAALEARVKELEGALDKLARLGNEPYFGNSIGNQIAQAALKKEKPNGS
jgi:hypothetical protein